MNNQNQTPESSSINANGFEDESVQPQTIEDVVEKEKPATKKRGRFGVEFKANFMSVFGHGIGKFALIAVGIAVVMLVTFAIRGFNAKPTTGKEAAAQMDVPTAPKPEVAVEPIDQKEADRRAQQAILEAEEASKKGQTYQPDFNPVVVVGKQPQADQQGSIQPSFKLPETQDNRSKPPVPPGDSPDNTKPSDQQVPDIHTGQSSANADNQQSSSQQEEQRQRQAELDRQRAARDKYIDQLRDGVREQAEELLGGKGKEGGIRVAAPTR